MKPIYPIFIPSKSRYDTCYTMKALEKIKVPYILVVESQERERYMSSGIKPQEILILPHRDQGLVVTRNWIWDYAQSRGFKRFWTMDDNIAWFARLNHNLKTPVADGSMLRAIEAHVDRYQNVPIAGMNYFMFASRKCKMPAFYRNTRIYSNMLIETNACDPSGKPYRNEGFYNDDTDLCLRVLKDGFCTLLYNAFLIWKHVTMTVKGGMTPHYQAGQDNGNGKESDGRYKMAKELQEKHPDVTKITWKWGRWQHSVDYSSFRKNELKLKPGVVIEEGPNEFGMVLQMDPGATPLPW